MKNNLLIILLLLFPGVLLAELEHSLMIKAPDIYRKARFDYLDLETRNETVYERKQALLFEGEYSFFKYYSASFSGGRYTRKKTDTEELNYFERFQVGLKARKYWENKLLTGAFFNVYSSQADLPQTEDENHTLFLVEGGFSLGYLFEKSRLSATIYMQSESNYKFTEEYGMQFRRFYQYELGYTWLWKNNLDLLIETAYRQPYDSEIDKESMFWYLYPGLMYKTSIGNFGFSLQHPMKKENREKGIKFTFIRYFKNISVKAE